MVDKAALKDRARDLSRYEKIVLSILRYRDSKVTSLQKLGLLIAAIFRGNVPEGFSAYYFGGFSDDIADSIEILEDEGYLKTAPDKHLKLTEDGVALVNDFMNDAESKRIIDISAHIAGGMQRLSENEILAIIYLMFPELTSKSLIKNRIGKIRHAKNVEVYDL